MTPVDWWSFFGHFLMLSMLAVGGAIAVAPDIHRYVVIENGWLTDTQFTDSIALAQAAPGPNLLFVAVVGWNAAGPAGAAVAMFGMLIPSTTLALAAARWGSQRRDHVGVRAFKAGMAPVTIGLMFSSGWVLTEPSRHSLGAMALLAATVVASLRTRWSPIWLIAAGAVIGALGWA